MNSIGMYRSPLDVGGYYQFVCPLGYHFMYNNENLGRFIWLKGYNNTDGYWIEKDLDI